MNDEYRGWKHHEGMDCRGPSNRHHRGFGLRYLILRITQKEPSTGAMIMDSLEEITLGRWRPSPGHVYPLLEEMSDEGLLNVDIRDGKKFYSATNKGKETLEESWFPWKMAPGIQNTSYNETLRNMESLVNFLVESKDKVREDPEAKKRIKDLIERLQYI
ncbi:MAG: PadR family transcriptional regulator [Thermoplasmatales archaeon]